MDKTFYRFKSFLLVKIDYEEFHNDLVIGK